MTYFFQCRNKLKPNTTRPARNWGTAETLEIPVCGQHAGVYDRALAKDTAYEQQKTAAREELSGIIEIARAIGTLLGVEVTPETHVDRKTYVEVPTGAVLIDARALLKRLESI